MERRADSNGGPDADAAAAPRYSALGIANRLDKEDAVSPTEEQRSVIEAAPAPMLVVAGAGSGKTTTMSDRVVWLVANGVVRPENILGLTFTRKAASELSRKIRTRLSRLTESIPELQKLKGEPVVSTYNAYAGNLVAEHGMRLGLESSPRVVTDAARWQLAYDLVQNWTESLSSFDLTVSGVTEKFLQLAGEMSEHLASPEALRRWDDSFHEDVAERVGKRGNEVSRSMEALAERRRQLLGLVEAWSGVKREHGVIDFADQLAYANELVAAFPDVVAAERDRWHVVLLDEYQDTSVSQTTLLNRLFGGGHPVTAVGDPIQSIYSWRGASAGALSQFPARFPAADGSPAPTVHLTASWRNRAEVLAVANEVSRELREGKSHGRESVPRIPPLHAGVGGSGSVRASYHATAEDEAAWTAERLKAVWTPEATAAVLVRARKQIPALQEALEAARLPVKVIGSLGLLHYPEVLEATSLLRVVANPADGPSLLRLLTGPRWRVGARDVKALWDRAREIHREVQGYEPQAARFGGAEELDPLLADAVADPGGPERYSPAFLERLARFQYELEWLRKRLHQSLPDLVSDAIAVTGLEVETLLHRGTLEHLDEFTALAAEYDYRNETASLPGFVSYLDALNEKERGYAVESAETEKGAVQILTVHAAKGLEWDVVAVPGLSRDLFPGKPRSDNWPTDPARLPYPLRGDEGYLPALFIDDAGSASDLKKAVAAYKKGDKEAGQDEECRLAYVALTRARHTLFMSGYYFERGRKEARPPAPYLAQALAAGAVEDRWAEEPSENPFEGRSWSMSWPVRDPLGDRQDAVAEGALLVASVEDSPPGEGPGRQWAEEAEILLRERDEQESGLVRVDRPTRLSTSQLMGLWADERGFALARRRPLPQIQRRATARGTDFHAWVEEFYGQQGLFDPLDLPGASDADLIESDTELERFKETFERSEWASRKLAAQEVPFVVSVGGVPVRGRIDAVFERADGGWDVVDWKTGRPPSGDQASRAAVQLAVYRHAWAKLQGVDPDSVSTAFYYVGADRTVRPETLPELDFD
ncbi:ATP-dependent helicase [Salininema proteolyticum]|uniref:DNA 3'-5' helicase n=1 Tax=Salininema proteolyticum TaxID=1607685 RepID=A0ABV8TZ02_9ACTN